MRSAFSMDTPMKNIFNAMKYIRADLVENPMRIKFLSTMLWFAAHEAASRGLWTTACDQLSLLNGEMNDMYANTLEDITEKEIRLQHIFFVIASCDRVACRHVLERAVDTQGLLQYLIELLSEELESSRLRNDGELWGSQSNLIFEEIRRLQKSLSLPVFSVDSLFVSIEILV